MNINQCNRKINLIPVYHSQHLKPIGLIFIVMPGTIKNISAMTKLNRLPRTDRKHILKRRLQRL